MTRATWRLVNLTLAGVMLIGLVAGCGQTKEPAASPVPDESSTSNPPVPTQNMCADLPPQTGVELAWDYVASHYPEQGIARLDVFYSEDRHDAVPPAVIWRSGPWIIEDQALDSARVGSVIVTNSATGFRWQGRVETYIGTPVGGCSNGYTVQRVVEESVVLLAPGVPEPTPPPATFPPPPPPPSPPPTFPPPTSAPPTVSTGGGLFRLVAETQVTPVGNLAGGAFVRCGYVPGRDRMVVAFKAQLSQEEAGCTDRWAQAYREYTEEMQETGDYGVVTCKTGPDVGGLLLGNDFYFAAMGRDPTKSADGWWLAKYDAVTWKPLVEPFLYTLEAEEKTADPMIAELNGQIDVSGKYRKLDDMGPGHATHHQFFTPDLQFVDKRVLTDVPHIDLTSLLGIGDVIHFVTSTDLWGEMIVIQYDADWNYLGTKTLKLHAAAPEGLAFDGKRFYVSYIDNSLSKPFEPGGRDNIRLAAFDASWNLLDDIAVTSFAPDEHKAPGRPSLTLRHNRIYVCYDQANNAMPDQTPEEADLQVYVKVYEVSQNP